EAWEGVAGIGDLRNRQVDTLGNLAGFDFTMDTPVGRIDDRAKVTALQAPRHSLSIFADQKGLLVYVNVALNRMASGEATLVDVEVRADAKSFLTKPLAATLNMAMAQSIENEARTIASRVL
ncbi:MAG: hypothetical protein V3V01_14165, partial [Acidimicrobiales bacterium]